MNRLCLFCFLLFGRSNSSEQHGARRGINKVQTTVVVAVLILFAGCTAKQQPGSSTSAATQTKRIVAVSYALQYLTQRVAGDEFTVEFPAASAPSPANWKPSVEAIALMQSADLIVINGTGAEYANWLVHTTLPAAKICSSCEDIKLKDLIAVRDHQIIHTHGPEGEHSHVYMVPYTWLDPSIAIQQAQTIAGELVKTYPESASSFQENLKSLVADLDSLAGNKTSAGAAPKTVLTANPHLKYLTRSLGLKDTHMLWFEWPTDDEWEVAKEEVEKCAEKANSDLILLTGQPSSSVAEFLQKQNLKMVQINLLDHQPSSGDYLSEMRKNVELLLRWQNGSR